MKNTLCPFSKPVIGNWCQCPQANLAERCAGKMVCKQADKYHASCTQLVDIFRQKSSFVLGIKPQQTELTHMQLMKIRCGGLLGMQRILTAKVEVPVVLDIIELAKVQFGSVGNFPFNEIVQDIQRFNHRKKLARHQGTTDPANTSLDPL